MNDNRNNLLDFEKFHSVLSGAELFRCKGVVTRVAGMVVEAKGLEVGVGELCGIHLDDDKRVLAEVIGFREGSLLLLPLENIGGVRQGNTITARVRPRQLALSNDILGRVLDGLGRPIDGKGPLSGSENRDVDSKCVEPLARQMISEPLSLGIRSIDGMLTCGKGQRLGIFAGSGVGKSVLLGEIANTCEAEINVVALVGERGREVREFIEDDLGAEGLARSVVIVATSDSAAVQRVRAAFVAVTIAEYFRDQGKNVMFMMDSLTRFAQAQREIGLAAGEPPASKGYCPSVFALMPRLVERLGCGDVGSITGMLTVLTEGDDMSDPVADSARSLLDGHFVLSRKLAEKGHYPAVDILQSISRLMDTVVEPEHLKAAQKLKEICAIYDDAEDLINIGAFTPGSNKKIDAAMMLIDKINEFLRQGMRERSSYDETVSGLLSIANEWDSLTAGQQEAATK